MWSKCSLQDRGVVVLGDDGKAHPVSPRVVAESAQAPSTASMRFDAFITAAEPDRPVANGIVKGLRQIGRRPGLLRALRVYAPDDDSDSAGTLDRSRYVIAVLSPAAASSARVDSQLAHWLQRQQLDRLLLVLADGRLSWDAERRRFDPDSSDAAPVALTEPGCLPAEPFYVDVSGDAPWDPGEPVFRDKVTSLAAPVHGKPKDQLAGDDVRDQRRFRRLRAAAAIGMALLLVASVIAGITALHKRRDAVAARDRATAQRLDVEAHGMLAGTRPGGDARAFQALLAAHALAPGDDGPLLHAAAVRATTEKIIPTGAKVSDVVVSPNGGRIASAGVDGWVRLWDTGTGHAVGARKANDHGDEVFGIAFSLDGTRLAVPAADNVIQLWNAGTRETTGVPLKGHTGVVTSLAFNADGRRLVSGGDAGNVRLWRADDGQPDGGPIVNGTTVRAVAFSPDGALIAVADAKGSVRLWYADVPQWATGPQEATGRLAGHTDDVRGVAFTADGSHLVTGGVDGTVRAWDLRPVIATGSGPILDVAISPDGHRLITGS